MNNALKQFQTSEYSNKLFKPPYQGSLGGLKKYRAPKVEIIFLDNEISLQLESTPPLGPGEIVSSPPEFLNNDPFKNSIF